ncbi:hypothetical protein [Deinococcus sp. Marseille-Q6407]|uniref:hypothetical protein n=1 Tax=Deinococcus sp. Marseille-Q6407 TaxID=2969223 RepID=UPI0021C1A8A3|nr:hypothetical protein [Deinococcus sp. Marseille-Q6407]
MQDDSTEEGFRTAETVLALLAQINEQHWLGTLLSRGALPLTYEWAQRLTRSFDEETADAVVLPEVMKTAFFLNRDDLPRSLRENHAERQALAAAGQAEPSEDLEF